MPDRCVDTVAGARESQRALESEAAAASRNQNDETTCYVRVGFVGANGHAPRLADQRGVFHDLSGHCIPSSGLVIIAEDETRRGGRFRSTRV